MSERSSRQRAATILVALVLGAATGCEEAREPWEPADREFRDFQRVFPVLMRDCGFHTCHGSDERFFRIHGPGRARLDPDSKAFDPLTPYCSPSSTAVVLSAAASDPDDGSVRQ